jgi:hypothetical protein
MPSFAIQLADIPIGVTCLYPSTRAFCRDYLTDNLPEFSVTLTQTDIDAERVIAREQDIRDGIPPQPFSDEYLETIALYRKLAEPLLHRNCIIFHGVVLAVNGEGYLFTAKSGTGKTTHARLWIKNILNSRIINGDKPLIKVNGSDIIAYGTMWCGKENYGVNQHVPLKALCILERGAENQITPVSDSSAFPVLYQQTHHLENPVDMAKALRLLSQLTQSVSLFRLKCNMEDEAAFVSYQAMRNGL